MKLATLGPKWMLMTWSVFLISLFFFLLYRLVFQRLYKICGRSIIHPSSRWNRPTNTMSWGSTRSQVSQRLWLCVIFLTLFCRVAFSIFLLIFVLHSYQIYLFVCNLASSLHCQLIHNSEVLFFFFQFLWVSILEVSYS